MSKKICFIIGVFLISFFPQKVFADNIVINEIFVHPSTGGDEWVEVYNPTNIDLTSYFIDDDTNFADDIGSSKKQLTTISNGTYSVFILSSSMFNNAGDFVVLFDSTGNIIDQYEYTSDPGIDVVLGRTPDGNGTFQVLESATQGNANSGILPTAYPIVLSLQNYSLYVPVAYLILRYTSIAQARMNMPPTISELAITTLLLELSFTKTFVSGDF